MTNEVGNSLRQWGHAEQAAVRREDGIAMFPLHAQVPAIRDFVDRARLFLAV